MGRLLSQAGAVAGLALVREAQSMEQRLSRAGATVILVTREVDIAACGRRGTHRRDGKEVRDVWGRAERHSGSEAARMK